jgi:phospholipase D1/2
MASPLADAHVTEHDRTLFPGQVGASEFHKTSANQATQDYNNARVLDFQKVDNYVSNQISTLETGELPYAVCLMSIILTPFVGRMVCPTRFGALRL